MALPATSPAEEVVADYQTERLLLKDHPMTFLRDHLREQGILSCAETQEAKSGAKVRSAGVVLIRQRHGKGHAILVTLADETGITNALVWARLLEIYRRTVMASRLKMVEGK